MSGFPFTTDVPPRYSGRIPDEVDLVVIGGGIIGICTALFAARGGARVALLEKGRVAAEQSSRNWGWIRQQGRDPAEMPIMAEAQRIWEDLSRETNEQIGLSRAGVTYFANDTRALVRYEAWLPNAAANGVDSKIITPAQIAGMFTGLTDRPLAALYTAGDLRAEPWVAVPALAEIAVREGVKIVEQCAVRCLDITNGKVTGVVTERGRITAPRVVLAGGAWSALFLRNHGVALPQLSVRSQVAVTMPVADIGQCAASAKRLAFRRRADGGYTLAPNMTSELFVGPDAFRALPKFIPQLRIDPFGCRLKPGAPKGFPDAWGTPRSWSAEDESPFERMRVLDPKPVPRIIAKLARDFGAMFPQMGEVKLRTSWAGMIDTMPDIVPVVDYTPIDGLIVGTGMSGHGFGIGPAMGRILADLAAGRAAGHDLSRFRFARFTDGTKMVPGPDV
ncbi:NAD(P)/FAD-dependent oxidoreductase [Sulfitobacter guttiformis]|uniref:Glycine/D-amino acid oxidase-like deaminating enzyme n=1 Tax=Sulfitobacter guttiformis TaxID=74349 RepID=A0A420DN97_9RHOB|nr:FAD-binding oxidoreductase [Sulfitobacter guttiformis]KIN73025.1 AgaE protein, conversion of agropinic acid to mannopinic acid [Sulfitobacter guttiformis KCTC 32187]RKE95711.1 glycine/D-amino acid oxidase-like deaminating enzyme [Sulfitobacter guttiformis]